MPFSRGMEIDRDTEHLEPLFRAKVRVILAELNVWCSKHKPGYCAELLEGRRSLKRQEALYAKGRSQPGPIVTNADGIHHRSKHQDGLAADIGPVSQYGRVDWTDYKFWGYLQHLAHLHLLTSGADWHGLKDFDHIELTS